MKAGSAPPVALKMSSRKALSVMLHDAKLHHLDWPLLGVRMSVSCALPRCSDVLKAAGSESTFKKTNNGSRGTRMKVINWNNINEWNSKIFSKLLQIREKNIVFMCRKCYQQIFFFTVPNATVECHSCLSDIK